MYKTKSLEVIHGEGVKHKVVLNESVKESIASRFLYHDAKLSTLAWEAGHSQGALCAAIVEIARKEGIAVGRRMERNLNRFVLPKAA